MGFCPDTLDGELLTLLSSLSPFFILGRMHTCLGVSSLSLNRSLIYGDLIDPGLPHEVLGCWVSKLNLSQSSITYRLHACRFCIHGELLLCQRSADSELHLYRRKLWSSFGSPLVFDTALTDLQFSHPSNPEDINNQPACSSNITLRSTASRHRR